MFHIHQIHLTHSTTKQMLRELCMHFQLPRTRTENGAKRKPKQSKILKQICHKEYVSFFYVVRNTQNFCFQIFLFSLYKISNVLINNLTKGKKKKTDEKTRVQINSRTKVFTIFSNLPHTLIKR